MKIKAHNLLFALGLVFLLGVSPANCKRAEAPEKVKQGKRVEESATGPVKFALVYQTMMMGETRPCG